MSANLSLKGVFSYVNVSNKSIFYFYDFHGMQWKCQVSFIIMISFLGKLTVELFYFFPFRVIISDVWWYHWLYWDFFFPFSYQKWRYVYIIMQITEKHWSITKICNVLEYNYIYQNNTYTWYYYTGIELLVLSTYSTLSGL